MMMFIHHCCGFPEWYLTGQGISPAIQHLGAFCNGCTPRNHLLRGVGFIGKHSMNLWFIHGIFFSAVTAPLFQPAITIFPHPLACTLMVLLLSLPPAVLMTILQQGLLRRLHRRNQTAR